MTIEEDYADAVHKEFLRQHKESIKFFNKKGAFKSLEAYSRRKHPELYEKTKAADTKEIDKWFKGWAKSVKPEKMEEVMETYNTKAATLGGNKALSDLGVSLAFDLKDSALIEEIKTRGVKITGEVTKKTLKDFRSIMYKGYMEQGVSPYQLKKDIKGMFEETYKNRAWAIARTETGVASSTSQHTTYVKNKVEKKEWSSILDTHTRESHMLANGQVRRMDEPFNVGGTLMDHPHDPLGPAAEVINCYDDKTEVLTHEGYVLFENLKEDMSIATLNPKTREIEYDIPKKRINYRHRGMMVHYKSKTVDLMVTKGHQIPTVNRWKKDKGVITITMKEAIDLNQSEMIAKKAIWKGVHDKWMVINGFKMDSKLFMEFLGWYIAEGSTTVVDDPRKKYKYQICITQSKEKNGDKYKRILGVSSKLFKKVWAGSDKVFIVNDDVGYALHLLGKSWEKYIPYPVKQFNRDHLNILLDAYCQGDGHIVQRESNHSKRRIFFTSSSQLADDIGELIIKCGKSPSFMFPTEHDYKKVKFKNGSYFIKHPCTWIFENNSDYFYLNKNYRNLTKYDGQVFCVEMAVNHIINVRRNGKVIWCGNCRCGEIPRVTETITEETAWTGG